MLIQVITSVLSQYFFYKKVEYIILPMLPVLTVQFLQAAVKDVVFLLL